MAGGCELPDVGAEKGPRVLYKAASTLTAEPSLSHYNKLYPPNEKNQCFQDKLQGEQENKGGLGSLLRGT